MGELDERGVSAIVGLVLIIGIVAIGSVGILVIGGQVNDDTKTETETARIEQSFLELGKDINTVAQSDESSRVVDLELPDDGDSAVREEKAGRIWVNRTNFTTATTDTLVDREIGSVRYDNDETTFAYQAGAVFSETGNQTQVLSRPAFEYTLDTEDGSPTLTLPIVTTVGPDALPNGEVRASKKSVDTPINDDTVVENDLVSVEVKSRWYIGWAEYFRSLAEKTGTGKTAVTVDHGNRTARFELIVPVTRRSVKGGIVSGSTAGNVTLANSIAVQSYNSSKCPFGACATKNDADVFVAGNITFKNKGHVDGNVTAGGIIKFDMGTSTDTCPSGPNKIICGYAAYGKKIINNNPQSNSSLIGKGYAQNGSVQGYDPVDTIIDAKINQAKDENDNDDPGVPISGDRLDCASVAGSTCTLPGGRTYFLEKITVGDLASKDLVLQTTGGPINIVVNGTVTIHDTEVTVQGTKRANIFIDSTESGDCDKTDQTGCDLDFKQSALQVTDPSGTVTDNASDAWVYMDSESDATIRGGSGPGGLSRVIFTGVIFGPGKGSNTGVNVSVWNKGTVQGAAVGNVYASANNGALRYDRRLRNTRTVVASTKVPRLTYLIVSAYEVRVEDD